MWGYLVLILVTVVLIYTFKSVSIDRIRFYTYIPILANALAICSVVFLPICLLRPKNVQNIRYYKYVAIWCKWVLDMKWEVRNRQVLEDDSGAIIVLNHQNAFDCIAISQLSLIANKLTALSKKEYLYAIPFGTMLYICGIIFVDRVRGTSPAAGDNKIRNVLQKDKTKILIYPEGTRNSRFPEFLKFKKGAFNMAVDAQVPVIPAVISPYYFINKTNKTFKDGGKMIVECLEPISTEGLTREDVPELTTRVQKIMQEAFIRLSKEILDQLPPDYPHEYHFKEI